MYVLKTDDIIFQILVSTEKADFASGPMIWSVEFKTTLGYSFGLHGKRGNLEYYTISVPGKKLAFITGTQGSYIDSLTFYFI